MIEPYQMLLFQARVDLEDNRNEGVLLIPQSPSITGTSPSDCLVSYAGHSLGGSYPSAKKQSVYSIAPADWVILCLCVYNMSMYNVCTGACMCVYNVKVRVVSAYVHNMWVLRMRVRVCVCVCVCECIMCVNHCICIMYVYVYAWIVCECVCVSMCVRARMVCECACVCVWMCTYNVCMHVCVCLCICMYVCLCVCICV